MKAAKRSAARPAMLAATLMTLAVGLGTVGCDGKKAAPSKGDATTATTAAAGKGDATKPADGSAAAALATKTAAQDAGPSDAAAPDAAAAKAVAAAAAADDEPPGPSRDMENAFEKIAEPELELDDPRVKQLQAALSARLAMPVKVMQPIEAEGGGLFALYEHAQGERCAADTAERPKSCPPVEAMALNPGCRGYGMAYARAGEPNAAKKEGGKGDAAKEPNEESNEKPTKEPNEEPNDAAKALELVAIPLGTGGCDLQVRHWFVGERKRESASSETPVRRDAYLEVVTSYVSRRVEPEGKKKKVQETTERQQLFFAWQETTKYDEKTKGIVSPDLEMEVAAWTAEPWRSPEPPVLDSVLLLDSASYLPLKLIHLQPCYDPWSETACATELRKRVVTEY